VIYVHFHTPQLCIDLCGVSAKVKSNTDDDTEEIIEGKAPHRLHHHVSTTTLTIRSTNINPILPWHPLISPLLNLSIINPPLPFGNLPMLMNKVILLI